MTEREGGTGKLTEVPSTGKKGTWMRNTSGDQLGRFVNCQIQEYFTLCGQEGEPLVLTQG